MRYFTTSLKRQYSLKLNLIVTRLTLDIICETAMGVKIEAQSNPDNQYVKDVGRIREILFCRMVSIVSGSQTKTFTLNLLHKHHIYWA